MRYLSLFSGIGGFELGIQQAYEASIKSKKFQGQKLYARKNSNRIKPTIREQSNTCVGYSETNRFAIQIYEKHFRHKNYGDITKINPSKIPDHDLVVGGFPCQSFSVAGKRGGFEDTRGTLFFNIAEIVKVKRPRLLLLENVKGLLSHNEGNTFATIISTLDELGYDCQWQVNNSKNFGVPQNRERVFIVGHSRGTSRPKVFPIGKISKNDIGESTTYRQHCISRALTASYGDVSGDGTKIRQLKGGSQGNRVYDPKGLSTTIASQAGGLGAKTGLYAVASRGRHLVNGKRKDILGAKTKQRLEARKDGLTNCLTSVEKDSWLSDGQQIRRLTPTECERLQGFPDKWTKYGIDEKGKQVEISDTQRYKCLGNAITVPVVREIIKRLL